LGFDVLIEKVVEYSVVKLLKIKSCTSFIC